MCRTLAESPMTQWLDRRNLHKYAQLFFDEAITFALLAKMSMYDLSRLGINKVGERKHLVEEVRARQSTEMYDELIRMLQDLDLDFDLNLLTDDNNNNNNNDDDDDDDDLSSSSPAASGRAHKRERETLDVGQGIVFGSTRSESVSEPQPELGPCPFETASGFLAEFSATDEVRQFNDALCKGCDLVAAKERGANCSTAQRAFRKLLVIFHPDKVQGKYPGCMAWLKPWATSAVTALTLDLNKMCLHGHTSRLRGHDEF